MNRDHVGGKLAEYAVGALRGRTKARVESHVRECEACRAELTALERTSDLLNSVKLLEAPPGTWEGIQARLAQRRQAPSHARRRPRPVWGLAMGAVALLLIVVGLFLLYPTGGQPTLVVVSEPDAEMQATIDAHVSTMWGAPLADQAAVGLRLAAENGG